MVRARPGKTPSVGAGGQGEARSMAFTGKNQLIRWSALGVVALVLAGCDADFDVSFESIGGSGDVETRTFDLAEADRIDVGDGFEVSIIVEPGAATVAVVTIDDNLFDKLEVQVLDGELAIGTKPGVNIYSRSASEIQITIGSLDELDLSGGSRAVVEGIEAQAFDLELSGGSRVDIEGSADRLELDASGGSNVHADELLVRSADVDLSGGSSAVLSVSGDLDVDASGGSDLRYSGNPSVSADLSGASSADAVN